MAAHGTTSDAVITSLDSLRTKKIFIRKADDGPYCT